MGSERPRTDVPWAQASTVSLNSNCHAKALHVGNLEMFVPR